MLIQRGALFLATNADNNMQMKHYKLPGAGCMVKAIECATEKEAYVIGKPNPDVIEVACKKFGLNKSECLMVGDNLTTDIIVGRNAGIDTFAVLTGLTTEEGLKLESEKSSPILPTYYWKALEV